MGLCKRCYCELNTTREEQRLICDACHAATQPPGTPPPPPEDDEPPFCCHSDPPCPSCPYG